MRKLTFVIGFGLGLPTLLLAGCANQQGAQAPFGSSLAAPAWPDMRGWSPGWPVAMTSAQAPGLVEEVGAARALAYLPPQAGQPVSVGERRGADGLEQDIVLAGGAAHQGQNRISVRMRWGDGEAAREALRGPTEQSIAREIEEAFPGGTVQPTTAVVANADGPIGIAAGRAGGANCVYAWQSLRTTRNGGWFEASAVIGTQVRVRLCSAGLSQQQLIQLVAGLNVAHAPQSRIAAIMPFNRTPAWVNPAPASYDPVAMAAPAMGGGYPATGYMGGVAPAGAGCGGALAAAGVCGAQPASAYALAGPATAASMMTPAPMMAAPAPRMVWTPAAAPLPPERPTSRRVVARAVEDPAPRRAEARAPQRPAVVARAAVPAPAGPARVPTRQSPHLSPAGVERTSATPSPTFPTVPLPQ